MDRDRMYFPNVGYIFMRGRVCRRQDASINGRLTLERRNKDARFSSLVGGSLVSVLKNRAALTGDILFASDKSIY